jgi:hypothetical protein
MSGYIGTKSVTLSTTSANVGGDSTVGGDLTVDTNTLYVDSTNNRVGVGTASPSNPFQVGTSDLIVDSSGNLLVGKTAADNTTAGGSIFAGVSSFVNDGARALTLVRNTSDGGIVEFRKGGTTVGSIGVNGGNPYIGKINTGLVFNQANDQINPARGDNGNPARGDNGNNRDNVIDLGSSSVRFDDIYATNGTIQTSDQNEKQQIASLTDAEITAAKAISKLFKTFKWNDSVAEKGDDARTHTGVIAQEVEAAMTAAGLNAGDYAFFISSDWTDEETGEERNRKGIRYPQLMSFIGAATEQRLASIEARLDALEGN